MGIMILSHLYRFLTWIAAPLMIVWIHWRVVHSKEDKLRIRERRGIASLPRPDDRPLVWIHAASNGEALSALPVIDYLRGLDSSPTILVTTMTVTGAQLMAKRLPQGEGGRCIHQYIPYDHPAWIRRFHDYWRPDAVLWIESELWPNHLRYIGALNIPAALLNARLSERSVRRWQWRSIAIRWFRSLVSVFTVILAQTGRDKENFHVLGVSNVICAGNLKDLAPPLPHDPYALEDLALCVGIRPVILYACTHDGEEEIAAHIHRELKSHYENILSIIVPRHPKRARQLIDIMHKNGLKTACRSAKMSPRLDTDIYIADTLGELGLFYRFCDIAYVGNSLAHIKPGGGHNLMEPALLGCAIISGNNLHNFSVLAKEMPQARACILVKNREELMDALIMLMEDQQKRNSLIDNALHYANDKRSNGLDNILNSCESIFKNARLI